MTTPRPETLAAADWWARQLAAPTRQDVGDADTNGLLNLAGALSRQDRTPEQIDAFRAALATRIEQHTPGALRTIQVDYGPGEVLEDAALTAGITLTLWDLPLKTTMWIDPGRVRVGVGYGAGPVTVWEALDADA